MSATDNSLCTNALELRSGQTTTVALRAVEWPCVEGQAPGASNYFAITVPPRSVATVGTGDSFRFGARFYQFDSCSDTRCRVALESGPIMPFSSVDVVNDRATPLSTILALVPDGARAAARMSLTTAPLVQALCESPTALTVGAPPQTAEFSRGGANATPLCRGPRALYYAITVPAQSVGRVEISNPVGAFYYARWIDGCAAIDCEVPPTSQSLLASNESNGPKTYLLELRGPADGSVQVAHTSNTQRGLGCAAPLALEQGTSARGDTASATSMAACAPVDRAQLFYAVTIAANTRGRFALRREGAVDVRARVLEACDSAQCNDSTATVDDREALIVIDNATAAPVQRIIAVSGTTGPATFSLQFAGSATIPTNQSCEQFAFVYPGNSAVVDTTNGAGAPVGCDTNEGRALYYDVVVGARQRATISLTRTSATDLRLRLYEDCAMGRCASSTATSSAAPITVELRNEGPMMRGFIVSVGAVGGPSSVGAGTLSVSAETPL